MAIGRCKILPWTKKFILPVSVSFFFLLSLTLLPYPVHSKAVADGNKVTFSYRAPEGTKLVYIAGTFNGWNTSATPLVYNAKEGVWKTVIELQTGEHQYKFVSDGSNWQTDPEAVQYSADEYKNAVIRVGLPSKIVASVQGDGDIFTDVILHEQKSPMLDLLSDGRTAFRLRVNKNDVDQVTLSAGALREPMHLYGQDEYFDYYRVAVKIEPGQTYNFSLSDGGKSFVYREKDPFVYKKPAQPFYTPDWAKNSVFYQIFTNSFANGNKANDPSNVVPWEYEPLYHQGGAKGFDAFYGGDIAGVIQKMGHLKELGVSAVYFTPMFEAQSTHKYNTADYGLIDDNFGTEQEFKDLIDSSHKNGVKVVIDGVFNHTGSGFFAFQDLIKNQENSKYKDWYFVKGWPVIKDGKPMNYEAWWGFGELPKLNVANPDTRKYIQDMVRKWGKLGIDGWRLDVANEITDPTFWKEFRQIVRGINPQGYIVGEIWDNAAAWLKGDQFDSVMNYRFSSA